MAKTVMPYDVKNADYFFGMKTFISGWSGSQKKAFPHTFSVLRAKKNLASTDPRIASQQRSITDRDTAAAV